MTLTINQDVSEDYYRAGDLEEANLITVLAPVAKEAVAGVVVDTVHAGRVVLEKCIYVRPLWWSRGQRSGFMLRRSEFDSHWLLNFAE